MKCPKCGHENSDGQIFCEECDWKLCQKYKQPIDKSQILVYGSFAAAALGIAAVVSVLLNVGIFGLIFGAIGMVLGSYTITLARIMGIHGKVKYILIAIQVIAIICSAIGFVLGLVKTFA